MKYLKTFIFEFVLLIILTLIISIFYYFNIISNNINNILKIVIFISTFLLSGIYISRRSSKKYYLEGLKISAINIIIFLLLSLIFKYEFNIKLILYYLLLTLITTLGSIIGGNFKKK